MDPKRTIAEYQMSESRHGILKKVCKQPRCACELVWSTYSRLCGSKCETWRSSWSEKFNSLSLRECPDEVQATEGDELEDTNGIIQIRLVTFEPNGLAIETNSLVFFELHQANAVTGVGAYGIMALVFVEQDELYQYRPTERVHKDVTGAVLVQADPEDPIQPETELSTWSYAS